MTVHTDVLVVGASAAGLATTEALRRNGFGGSITLLGAEPHLPYDRPPLSKQVLAGDWTADRTRLRAADAVEALNVDLALGEAAVALDVAGRSVRTDRRTITADDIVIATGAHPRRLPGQPDLPGVHVLRSVEDSLALRSALSGAAHVVVVGDGVLGAEIAATTTSMGIDVTLVGPQDGLMRNQLGDEVSGVLTDLHAAHGVRLRLGDQVVGFVATDGRVAGVELGTGETLPADVVVVAIGAVPATDWLTDSGLSLDDGVLCDSGCRAAAGIYAAGDVARVVDETTGQTRRLENRTNATEQGIAVAAAILGVAKPYAPIPYFWSDQFATRIQVDGTIPSDAEMSLVEGDLASGRFVASYHREGVVTGVVGWNMPKQSRRHRRRIGGPVHDLEVPVA
ncbi:FAD-dependent oxidoreductase [Gordonia sp. CPCC 206044]|uniref:NAD(P)/FAD-dependent oxidoreductase n=1 Tax=Gordonia sp. CPCC 206044 TaxID=3140793 RepID=UPI003AF38719